MKKFAVIPARYQASRFPGKLMQTIGNDTIISLTYQNTLKTALFDDVFVVTDSDLIEQEIKKIKGKVIRSQQQHQTGSDRIAEVVKDLDCDLVLNVQGDEPFTSKQPLQQLIQVFEQDTKQTIDVASLMLEITDLQDINNPNNVKVITNHQNDAMYFSRSVIPFPMNDQHTAIYHKHIGIYAFRKQALLQFSKLPMLPNEQAEKIEAIRFLEHGMRFKMVKTKEISFGIDTPEDLETARNWHAKS